MTLDELQERIKAEIVLHEGDVAQYQWQQLGLVQEAAGVGLSNADFFRVVNQVSLSVQSDFGRIADLKQAILTRLRGQKGKLTNADLDEFSQEAERARLSRSFVVDTWIPQLKSQLPPTGPEPVVPAQPPVTPPAPSPLPYPPTASPPGETLESMRQKVADSLNDYGDQIPAPAIRSLFRTISYSEAELSVAIWNYLQIHQYQPVTELSEGSLREKLTTTDWHVPVKDPVRLPPPVIEPIEPVLPPPPAPIVRSFTATPARVKKGEPVTLEWEVENLLAVTIDDLGEGLSPKNRGWVKPSKTADYTLFDVNDNPLSTVRVEVEKPDRSGLYGVLFAAALLLVIYWFVKSSSGSPREPEPVQKTEQVAPAKKKSPVESEVVREPEASPQPTEDIATDTAPSIPQADNKPEAESTPAPVDTPPPAEPDPQPATPADARRGKYKEEFGGKPYDKVELGTDDQGWRRARKNGRWGYVNDADEWTIEPEYEAVTPFKGNTASVFLNGQLMTINRDGEQVRK